MDCKLERIIPFYKIDKKIVDHLFYLFDRNLVVESITPLLEGCRNTNYVVRIKNNASVFLLRIFPINDESWKKEKKLLTLLKNEIPVQKLYFLSQDESIELRTFAIYEFAQGITLQSAMNSGYVLEENLIKDIGKTMASIHNHVYTKVGFLDDNLEVKSFLPPLETWYGMFLGENARSRLGAEAVKNIEKLILSNKESLEQMGKQVSLVHGDFRPTNILVYNGKLSCILDWEFVMAGHPISDIGQFFREEQYLDKNLISVFEKSYSEISKIKLSDNWYKLGKLRDLVNLIQMINGENDLPEKHKNFKKLIISTLQNYY
ncbi:phosphotransferase family protein [Clostridium sp. UBA6640]|uniref:phosphotransferase family protein n=1 Tax=Clostridium sp. UBA6640 TaxID=1946370 RepID=UPI0025C28D38|nr:aminoglycoside phosphotransferase family protein [Clostridium sp. UBA6640]